MGCPLGNQEPPAASLDGVAKQLHKQLKDSDTESFIIKATKPNEELQLKFDIVKHIIAVRLAENEEADKARERKERKQRILAIIAAKEDQALESMDVDALRKLVEES